MSTGLHASLLLIGSILAGGAFVATGMRMYANRDMVTEILAGKGIPYPRYVTLSGAAIEVILGGLLVAGILLPYIAAALAAFVLAATIMVHDFWKQSGAQRELDLGIFISNLIMVGSLLGLSAAAL